MCVQLQIVLKSLSPIREMNLYSNYIILLYYITSSIDDFFFCFVPFPFLFIVTKSRHCSGMTVIVCHSYLCCIDIYCYLFAYFSSNCNACVLEVARAMLGQRQFQKYVSIPICIFTKRKICKISTGKYNY